MIHSTRTPSFPANLSDYAPWVATHGLLAPYGKCQCGCNEDAPIAPRTHSSKGIIGGQPQRYVRSHHATKPQPVNERRCTKCQKIKSLSEYTLRASGVYAGKYESQCRACKNAHGAKYRASTSGIQKRNRENMREWRERNREWYRQYTSMYRAENREVHREQVKKGRAANPLREKAHSAVRYAIRRGDLSPAWAMVCEVCQEAQALEYHHHLGYAPEHWLDVKVVCLECHGAAHRVEA